MMLRASRKPLRRIALWFFLELLFAATLLVISAWADSPSSLREPKTPGCYCHCAQSKTSAGCAKMCELPKYASRWWAVTCAKPRYSPPAEAPQAGPRMPHPDRPERASN